MNNKFQGDEAVWLKEIITEAAELAVAARMPAAKTMYPPYWWINNNIKKY